MRKLNLIRLLKTFSRAELREFHKFIESPYFTRGKNLSSSLLLQLLKIIGGNYPKFDRKDFTRELVYQKLYPGKKYSDVIFRNLIASLLKLAESYLVYSSFAPEHFEHKKYLLRQLSERRADTLYEKQKKLTEHYFSRQKLNAQYFDEKYVFGKLCHNHNLNRHRGPFGQDIVDNFFHSYISTALSFYQAMLSFKNTAKKKYNYILFDEITNHVSKNIGHYNRIPVISVAYNELMLYLKQDELYYNNLKRLKDESIEHLDRSEQLELYKSLTNFCITNINSGNNYFRQDAFELFNETLNRQLHKESGYFNLFYFMSMALISLDLKEYKWVEEFIGKYGNDLEPGQRDYGINLSHAALLHAKKNYGEALKRISKINTALIPPRVIMKVLVLKIYYDSGETEAALSLMDSAKHTLHRDENMPDHIKTRFANFIKFLNDLIGFKNGVKSKDIDNIRREISRSENLVHKDWMVQKAEELLN